jgi:TetR/AcrR family transcriptional repressor of uid operon
MNVDVALPAVDQAAERILDAATAEFARRGVRRTTMNQVADTAGLGVATVYRRFSQKAELVRAVVLREAGRVIAAVMDELQRPASAEEQAAGAFTTFAHAVSRRPLLVRLMRAATDGEDAAPYDLVNQLMTTARQCISDWIRHLQSQGRYLDADPDVVAELEARLAVSLVLLPKGFIPMHDDVAMRAFATKYLVPLLGPEYR